MIYMYMYLCIYIYVYSYRAPTDDRHDRRDTPL